MAAACWPLGFVGVLHGPQPIHPAEHVATHLNIVELIQPTDCKPPPPVCFMDLLLGKFVGCVNFIFQVYDSLRTMLFSNLKGLLGGRRMLATRICGRSAWTSTHSSSRACRNSPKHCGAYPTYWLQAPPPPPQCVLWIYCWANSLAALTLYFKYINHIICVECDISNTIQYV